MRTSSSIKPAAQDMTVEVDLIFGDDEERTVFSLANDGARRLLIKFCLNKVNPQILPSRIATCFHELEVVDESYSFRDRNEMRDAILDSIRRHWDECLSAPFVTMPDAVIQIIAVEDRENILVHWGGLYQEYTKDLKTLKAIFEDCSMKPQTYSLVRYSDLIFKNVLGGRGNASIVQLAGSSKKFVFKGVDFARFLESPANFIHWIDCLYMEIRTIHSLGEHPNIKSPVAHYVTARPEGIEEEGLICGTLDPYLKLGDLDGQIVDANSSGMRISVRQKAMWCCQMTSAITHTHFVSECFHMDIKPSNFLLDDDGNLVLIDWEQNGAPPYALAPEADGSWDVELANPENVSRGVDFPEIAELRYTRFEGPTSTNSFFWPSRNVFPVWRISCPRALEAAQTFGLGMTMWMLLNQVPQMEIEDLAQAEVDVQWGDSSSDIPHSWKQTVGRCVDENPNKRIRLEELLCFWETEVARLGIGGFTVA